MIQITGAYQGELLQNEPPFEGKIIGVFHHGWYLCNEHRVFMIHDCTAGYLPFGVRVCGFEKQFPYDKKLEGTRVRWTGSKLCFEEAELKIHMSSTAPKNDCAAFTPENLAALMEQGKRYLATDGKGFLRLLLQSVDSYAPDAVFKVFLTHSASCIKEFLCDLRENSAQNLEENLRTMVGFGIGLTPSMDDWLVGFMYVICRTPEMDYLKKALFDVLNKLSLTRTNKISREYLMASAEGYYFELLQKAGKNPNRENIFNLMKIGGSSGSDMLTGMVFACKYILGLSIGN